MVIKPNKQTTKIQILKATTNYQYEFLIHISGNNKILNDLILFFLSQRFLLHL